MNVQLMESSHRNCEPASGLADRNSRAAMPQAEPVRTTKTKTSKKEEVVSVAEEKPSKVKFAKGSEEAKAHMAALRAKRGAAPAKEKKEKAVAAPSQPEPPVVQKVKGKKVAEEAVALPVAKPKKKKIVQVEIEVSDSE